MKTIAFQNRIVRFIVGLVVAAVVMAGISPISGSRTGVRHAVTISAHHAVQLADGTESNGGKGGKGGAKRSGIA